MQLTQAQQEQAYAIYRYCAEQGRYLRDKQAHDYTAFSILVEMEYEATQERGIDGDTAEAMANYVIDAMGFPRHE